MHKFFLLLAFLLPAGGQAQTTILSNHPLQNMKLEVVFAHAVDLSGYLEYCEKRIGGCPMPSILIREFSKFEGYRIVGEFEWTRPERVNVSRDVEIGSIFFTEIVFHEMVHYLDWLRGRIGPSSSCERMAHAELRAYDLTTKFLQRHGIKKDFASQKEWHDPKKCTKS